MVKFSFIRKTLSIPFDPRLVAKDEYFIFSQDILFHRDDIFSYFVNIDVRNSFLKLFKYKD